MANRVDPQMPQEIVKLVDQVIEELELDAMDIRFDHSTQLITFKLDRRVVDLPLALVSQGRWSDVRYLFRAILDSAPGQKNMGAEGNDWSYVEPSITSRPPTVLDE